jgi:hypothetical protein
VAMDVVYKSIGILLKTLTMRYLVRRKTNDHALNTLVMQLLKVKHYTIQMKIIKYLKIIEVKRKFDNFVRNKELKNY